MGIRVLVVDDNRPFLDAACALLQRQGLTVLGAATTAAQARNLVEQLRPDVVLVDINLGAESGFELARRLTEDNGHRSTVILMSTHAETDFADLIADSPAAGFVPKSDLSADAIRLIRDEGGR